MERGWDCGGEAGEAGHLRWLCSLMMRLMTPRRRREREKTERAESLDPGLPPRAAKNDRRIDLLRRIKRKANRG